MPGEFRFHPPLRACLLFAVKSTAVLFAVIALAAVPMSAIRGRPLPSLFDLMLFSVIAVAVMLCMTLAIYGVFRLAPWSIDSVGMKGRSYWGPRRAFTWAEIADARRRYAEGIPGISVRSSSGQEIYACVLAIDARAVYASLSANAGPAHPMTRLFEPIAPA